MRELLCGCWVSANPQARGDPQPSSEGSCWVGEGQRGKTSISCFTWKAAGLWGQPLAAWCPSDEWSNPRASPGARSGRWVWKPQKASQVGLL